MVWNEQNSPLYRSVEKYNNGAREIRQQEFEKSESPPPCPKPSAKQHSGAGQQVFLQKITNDRDFLLIAVLILLLWHEKADIKLIVALAYVLLG